MCVLLPKRDPEFEGSLEGKRGGWTDMEAVKPYGVLVSTINYNYKYL